MREKQHDFVYSLSLSLSGKTTKEEGHHLFFGGKEDKCKHVLELLVRKDIVNTHGMPASLQQAHH